MECPLKPSWPSPPSFIPVPATVPVLATVPVPADSPTLDGEFYHLGWTKDYGPIDNGDSD